MKHGEVIGSRQFGKKLSKERKNIVKFTNNLYNN